MAARRYLSPQQVADALGVSVTTLKRWVDDGTLPAHRTAGGHRRILVCDVLRLARAKNWPQVNLEVLSPLVGTDALNACQLALQVYDSVVAADIDMTRALLVNASQGGMGIGEIADRIISPVMVRVGQGWADGVLDVSQEHRATLTCLAALEALRPRGEGGESDRPVALGGGPEGDHYLLANLLIDLLLQENGWRVVALGPNMPMPSFRRAMREHRPRLVWLSASYLADPEPFLAGYQELYEEAKRLHVAVAVGGRALIEPIRARMQYTMFGDGLTQLTDFLQTLHPRKSCPQGKTLAEEAESVGEAQKEAP